MRRGIDHLVLAVNSLDAAAERFEALGFTLTPRASHPWGTDNRLVQLQGNFLEIVEVARPDRIESSTSTRASFGEFNQKFLEHHEGMSMLVLETTDAARDREEFDGRGIGGYEPFHFERKAKLPDGNEVTVAFSLAYSSSPALPAALFFCCQQHAPEHFWKPTYQSHANAASIVAEVYIAVDDLDAAREYFAKLQEPDAVTDTGGGLVVETPRGNLRVYRRDDAGQAVPGTSALAAQSSRQFLGFGIRIDDLNAQAARLRDADIEFTESDGRLWISPAQAFGCAVCFQA